MRVIRRWMVTRCVARVELAHALVEQVDQILDAVRHRRVGGEAGVARIFLLGDGALGGAAAILQIGGLGERNDVGEDFDFFLDAGPAAEEGVDGFLEIEQPERQPQIARGEHLRLFAEAAAIFVVRVDQEDAQVRPRVENLLQDDGDAARFADAGGAENGEMAADQIVDIDVHADVGILLQVADMGVIAVGAAVDQAKLAFAEQHGVVADGRILGDAALETAAVRLGQPDFAEQVEAGDLAERLRGRRLLADFGDHADDQRRPGDQADEFSDRGLVGAGHARGQFDGGLRAGDRR